MAKQFIGHNSASCPRIWTKLASNEPERPPALQNPQFRAENRKKLTESLREYMKDDRAKHKILPPSRFGLIEITRQRVRPQITIKTREKCPSCYGSGEIEAPIVLIDEIKDTLESIYNKKSIGKIILKAHPFVIAYLQNGFFS